MYINPLSAIGPENFWALSFGSRKGMGRAVELHIATCRVPLGVDSLCNFEQDWTTRIGQMCTQRANGEKSANWPSHPWSTWYKYIAVSSNLIGWQ